MDFQATHPDAPQIRALCLAACGLETDQSESSLLSSLPCELTFNDLRDGERRSQKNEFRSTPTICAGAIKSGWSRSPLGNVTIDSKDWSTTDSARQLRSNILSSARSADKDLGIPMSEITSKQTVPHMTKPHVLTQRLLLYRVLREENKQTPDINLQKLLSDAWPCRMLKSGCLWKPSPASEDVRLVLSPGPHVIRYMTLNPLKLGDEIMFQIPTQAPHVEATLRFDGRQGELSAAVGVAREELGLILQAEAWLPPKRFLLTHTILQVPASFIAHFTKMCGLGNAKSTHKERVQLLLESESYPKDYINEILESLPTRTRQPKGPDDEEEAPAR